MPQSVVALLIDERCDYFNEALRHLRTASTAPVVQFATREYRVSPPSHQSWRELRRLRRRLLEDQIGAIHALSPGFALLSGGWLSARTGLPLIANDYGKPTMAARRYNGWLFSRCARVIVPSDFARSGVVAAGWAGAERLVVARAGVDSDMFSPMKRAASLRGAWRVSDRRPAIVCTGPMSDRQLALLAGIRSILAEYRRPHRFVVASCRDEVDSWQRAIPDAAFVDDFDQVDLSTVVASGDIFLTTGQAEPDPSIMLLIAQSSGLPVVAPYGGGYAEAMLDGTTGHACHAGSERDFAWRTAELLANTSRRSAMSTAAVAYARSRTWASSWAPVVQAYEHVLRPEGSARKANPAIRGAADEQTAAATEP